jgi:hypothetical protein
MTAQFNIINEDDPTSQTLTRPQTNNSSLFFVNDDDKSNENNKDKDDDDNMSVEEITSFNKPTSKPSFPKPALKPTNKFNQNFSAFMNTAKADIPPPPQFNNTKNDSEMGDSESDNDTAGEDDSESDNDTAGDNDSEAGGSEAPSERSFSRNRFVNPQMDRKQRKKEYYEKKTLLNELNELQKEGYKLYDSYNMKSNIDDIRHEVELGHRYFNIIYGQQQIVSWLFTFVRFVEKAVERIPSQWNPLNVKLNGLYNGLAQDRKKIEYDVKRLLKKYTASSGEVFTPEVSLLCTLTFAIAQTIVMNYGGQFILKQAEKFEEKNPGFMDTVMNGMQTVMGMAKDMDFNSMMPPNTPSPSSFNGAPFTQQQQSTMQPPQTNIDIKSLFQNNGGPTLNPQSESLRPQHTRNPATLNPIPVKSKVNIDDNDPDRFSDLSSVVSSGSEVTEKSTNSKGRRGKNSLDIL